MDEQGEMYDVVDFGEFGYLIVYDFFSLNNWVLKYEHIQAEGIVGKDVNIERTGKRGLNVEVLSDPRFCLAVNGNYIVFWEIEVKTNARISSKKMLLVVKNGLSIPSVSSSYHKLNLDIFYLCTYYY